MHPDDLPPWNRALAQALSLELQLTLTEQHWILIEFARAYYHRHHRLPAFRIFLKLCQEHIDPTLNSAELHRLFLGKPLATLARLGGLPKPPHCL